MSALMTPLAFFLIYSETDLSVSQPGLGLTVISLPQSPRTAEIIGWSHPTLLPEGALGQGLLASGL